MFARAQKKRHEHIDIRIFTHAHTKTHTTHTNTQVMGPSDGYLCQFSRNTGAFWADPHDLALGASIKPKGTVSPRAMVHEVRTCLGVAYYPTNYREVAYGN